MKISRQKITWMSVSCVFATLAGFPALADDTELLLANPDPSLRPKANVLFILDTSTSMQEEQETIEPYDSSVEFSGDCDVVKYYWTTNPDVTPDCGTTDQIIDVDKFVCDEASRLIDGIGSYTDTMVQFRDGGNNGNGSGPKRWQTIAPGYTGEFVECAGDSGVHGDGQNASRVYAKSGNNIDPFWTSNANQEIAWGSGKAKTQYTVYKGNYLNWKSNPQTVTWTRSEIMISVASTVLNSVTNLNVGLMRFNQFDGGPVIHDIVDIDVPANRQTFLDAVGALPANGFTPLSETMLEAALFWRGIAAHYGELIDEIPTDPAALSQADPEVYDQPDFDVCAKNYNVLLTDGEPFFDQDTPGLMGLGILPGHDGTCDGTGDGRCLDDIAEYLFTSDVNPLTEEEDLVSTHTIGFTIDLPILAETAADSGGQYFLAEDVETLTKSLLQIIAAISDRSTSFAAPAVSVNSFNRTQNLNDVYMTTFDAKSNYHWPGNLKKYRIANGIVVDANGDPAADPNTGFFSDTAQSYWTTGGPDGNDVELGGAAQQLPDPLVRNLYTDMNDNNISAAANHISTANAGSFTDADLGLTGAAEEPSKDRLIRWLRGEDTEDFDTNPATLVRNSLGDPLHSQPAAVVYGGTAQNPEVVVYSSTNDGYLHAVDGNTGVELWSYIPEELLPRATDLFFDAEVSYKQYGLDGNIVPIVKDVDDDGIVDPGDGDFVQLIFGMRRGGTTTYALDVTDRNAPQLLWKVDQAGFGESWSTPVVARVDVGSATQNVDKAVVVMGGGYDVVHDTSIHPNAADAVGASVHMYDLRTGVELWNASSAGSSDLTLSTMTRSIPNQLTVVDFGGDGFADRMYATDMGGQVLRFDIVNGQDPATLVTGGVIARFGAETIANPTDAETRRFYNAPDISLITDPHQQRRYVAVSVGSGYRVHPFDIGSADRFFSLRDGDVFNQLSQAEYNSYPIATDADLVEVSGQTQTVVTANDRGWKFTLPDNQKVLAKSLTFNDEIFFVAFSPDTSGVTGCTAAVGTNFLYRMNAINGDPVVTNIEALDPADSDDARSSTLAQGGIAPSPTILFPSPDDPDNCTGDECSPPPIYCVGLECESPGFENNPVRTLWTQDGIE